MAILSASTKRETGKKAQLGNIAAAKVPPVLAYSAGPAVMSGLAK